VTAHRPGALERVAFLLQDWQAAADKLTDTETRMTDVLDELKLTELATSIPGLSAVAAAVILAETGDPNRFATARALVKHAGLTPREKLPGAFVGRTKLTGQGRPALRLAAWRAVWGAQRSNAVYAARYQPTTALAVRRGVQAVGPEPADLTHRAQGVPDRPVEQPLRTVRRPVPGMLRNSPPVALGYLADQRRNVPARVLPRLRPDETRPQPPQQFGPCTHRVPSL
jgi:hypothetical protein